MLEVGSALAGLAIAVGVTSLLYDPQFAELCSASRLFGTTRRGGWRRCPQGEMFDRVYNLGSLTNAPVKDVQTVSVPPGGATVVEIKLEFPGKFMLVDHALSRVERGLAGVLEVSGPDNPNVFKDYDPAKSAKSMSH